MQRPRKYIPVPPPHLLHHAAEPRYDRLTQPVDIAVNVARDRIWISTDFELVRHHPDAEQRCRRTLSTFTAQHLADHLHASVGGRPNQHRDRTDEDRERRSNPCELETSQRPRHQRARPSPSSQIRKHLLAKRLSQPLGGTYLPESPSPIRGVVDVPVDLTSGCHSAHRPPKGNAHRYQYTCADHQNRGKRDERGEQDTRRNTRCAHWPIGNRVTNHLLQERRAHIRAPRLIREFGNTSGRPALLVEGSRTCNNCRLELLLQLRFLLRGKRLRLPVLAFQILCTQELIEVADFAEDAIGNSIDVFVTGRRKDKGWSRKTRRQSSARPLNQRRSIVIARPGHWTHPP